MDITLLTSCPQCQKHPMLTIESEYIYINCQCGYDNMHSIKDGISISNNNKNIGNNNLFLMYTSFLELLLLYYTFPLEIYLKGSNNKI